MMSDDSDQGLDLERLIALQMLRIEQVRIHLDELDRSCFEAKRAQRLLENLTYDLAMFEALREERRPFDRTLDTLN
jgi:hypothetical protein